MANNYRSELVFLFGNPVDDNPTGVMMEAAFKACDINYRYITAKVLVEDLEKAFNGAKAMNAVGINLTMPHKSAIIPYLDGLSEAASIIGAVNTVYKKDGKYIGDNTDGKGFIKALSDEGVTIAKKKVYILGAGGAAKAIATECALAGASQIIISNRTLSKAEELAKVINEKTSCKAHAIKSVARERIPADVDILINGTSIGLAPNSNEKPDIDYLTISENMVVSDVVFYPAHSLFLQEAEHRGALSVNGLGMLVRQGVLAFELWTGLVAPVSVMSQTLQAQFV